MAGEALLNAEWVKGLQSKVSSATEWIRTKAADAYTRVREAAAGGSGGSEDSGAGDDERRHHHHLSIDDDLLEDEDTPIGARVHLEHELHRADAKARCQVLLDHVLACGLPGTAGERQKKVLALRNIIATMEEDEAASAMNYIDEDENEDGGAAGTPLFLAAKLNVPAAAEAMLNRGASMVRRPPEDGGMSPLEAAEAFQSIDVLDLFLDRIATLENAATRPRPWEGENDHPAAKRKRTSSRRRGRGAA